MKRIARIAIIVFLVAAGVVFAAALAGGLMDDRAFTPAAKGTAH